MAEQGTSYSQPKAIRIYLAALEKRIAQVVTQAPEKTSHTNPETT